MPINIELHENFDGTLDGRYKQGDKPNAASGGTPALAWSAPQGLSDGNTLTITTDGTYNFGVAPKFATLGFGNGFLQSASLGDALTDVVDPISGQSILYENDISRGRTPNRFVQARDGIRALHQTNSGYSNGAGFGFVAWDSGATIQDGEPVFVSSWTRSTVSAFAVDINGDPLLATQWKSWRFRDEQFFDSTNGYNEGNSGYWKYWAFNAPTYGGRWLEDDEGEFTNYLANGSALNAQGLGHTTFDDKWTRSDLLIKPVVDASGFLRTRVQKPADAAPASVKDVAGFQFIDSAHPRRWRWLQEQSYIKDIVDLDLWVTDYFFQVGTFARFELANGATPATTTDSKILPPTSWSGNSVSVHLYKQMFSGYSGAYLHYYDINDNFVTGVAL